MENRHKWETNKFILDKTTEKWLPNVDYPGISNHSYIIANNQITYYQKFIEKYISGYLLDCGCGDVPYYGIYEKKISDVFCIDWENTGTQQIHIDKFVNLNERIDITSDTFDSILLSDVLEHIANPELLLQELSRILKKNGFIVIMVPFLYRIHEEPHDYYRYTEYALKHLLSKSGFKIIEFESYGGGVDVLFDLLNKIFFNSKRRSQILIKLYQSLIRINRIRRINEERRYSFPLGYCVAAQKNA